MLDQGIDCYDTVLKNLDAIARAYNQYQIDPGQEPRLFLIAPSFSASLQNRIKWINIPISLFTYQCIKFQDSLGEIVPVYNEITSTFEPERALDYEDETGYEEINQGDKILAQAVLGKIHEWDRDRIIFEPTQFDISIKISGRVLCYIGPKKNHLIIYTNDTDGKWTGYPIHSERDFERLTPVLRANYDKLRIKGHSNICP